jgi:tRNA threonylcarbamoyladenosine biosynthesis protein TsaE
MKVVKLGASQTKNFGRAMAKKIKRFNFKGAAILGLRGELGAGKTTFVQGFAEEMAVKEKVLSPTFIIMRHFKLEAEKFTDFYHFDCYRIAGEKKELAEINFWQIIDNPQNVVLIEWADRIESFLPEETVWLDFKVMEKNKREIIVNL